VRRFLQFVQWLCLSVLLMGVVVPIVLTWTTEVLSLEAVTEWVHASATHLASEDVSSASFQITALLMTAIPLSILLLLIGGLSYFGQKFYDKQPEVAIQKLEEQLERFLLIYDNDFNFTGRLRKLIDGYDEDRFQELRRVVYQAVFQYCGALEDGKETFLMMPGDKAMLSVVNEEVYEAVTQNLLNVKACRQAIQTPATQLVPNSERQRAMIMTAQGWPLPDCKAILVCPVYVGSTATGLVGVYHSAVNAFSTDVDQVFLELMASILSLAYTVRAKEVAR
jgi:hypothetical protein